MKWRFETKIRLFAYILIIHTIAQHFLASLTYVTRNLNEGDCLHERMEVILQLELKKEFKLICR